MSVLALKTPLVWSSAASQDAEFQSRIALEKAALFRRRQLLRWDDPFLLGPADYILNFFGHLVLHRAGLG
jgi:hypothetical protein